MNATRNLRLSQGFSAGNYCNAYESEDFTRAIATRNPKGSGEAYETAFIMGFFASYELYEIPKPHYERFVEAYQSRDGQRVLELGYCDPREELGNKPQRP